MIKSIHIQDEASFLSSPQSLTDLSKHNYIFGANGTGKTTISRIIANESAYPHCTVKWDRERQLEALVYNRDFVDRNFNQTSEIKGIFTLGEDSQDINERIAEVKLNFDTFTNEIKALSDTLVGQSGQGGKRNELEVLNSQFAERCWKLKLKYDAMFQEAFTGVRGRKVAFSKKLLNESKSNIADCLSLELLEKKAQTIFGETPEKTQISSIPNYTELLKMESSPILPKRVIGRSDVDIAAMILKLGNSDWVKQGRNFYKANNQVCPFCQQSTEDTLEASLNEYFDEAFENDSEAIEEIRRNYKMKSDLFIIEINSLINVQSEFLDNDKLKSLRDLLVIQLGSNLRQIERKRIESSQAVELDSLIDAFSEMKDLIEKSNTVIIDHNRMVTNLNGEKRLLTSQIWKYLIENEISSELESYNKARIGLKKAIESLTLQISRKEKKRRGIEILIRNLERSTTSIQPTIDEINELLCFFGFSSFVLAKSDRERYYKIVRPDGTDAKETLSEGEKNFITFLYFYHLLKGSETESGMTCDRIVVFDDPVSSLDSDILFIVSTLIKELLEDVENNIGHIKQVFILTHNVYFHREVSFNTRRSGGSSLKDEAFWIVRKTAAGSVLKAFEANPIKTSYELLWMEVRNSDRSSLSIQNTLRRILENYYKILGNVDPDSICSYFDGREKLICKSLFSWVNAGSHFAHDDLYVSVDEASIDKYLTVFKNIFYKTNHSAHYMMMMGEDPNKEL